MHENVLHEMRSGMGDRQALSAQPQKVHRPLLRCKKAARELIRLLSALSYFAGLAVVIVTAAGFEQDVLSGRQFIGWGCVGIGLMVIIAVTSWITERREEP